MTGSGLGLAIVDRIVRRSGGCVALSDTEPHGLTVKARFPSVSPSAVKKALKLVMKSDSAEKKTPQPPRTTRCRPRRRPQTASKRPRA